MRHRRNARPELDREAERYYVYRLLDADGKCLYIGRSCDPVQRLKSHHASGAEWPALVVQMEGWGPFAWGEACRREREAIYAERPAHNRMFVVTHTQYPVSVAG